MTALPTHLFHPPADGWTLADLEQVPEGARVEILDGALIVNPSPLPLHQRMVRRLAAQLEPVLPPQWQLETDVDVMLGTDPLEYVTPDVVVFGADVPLTTRPIDASQVVIVVEVVSRGSRREDRGSKPLAYADAGVPWYWRIESSLSNAPATPTTLHEHRLVTSALGRGYREVARHTGRCMIGEPFPLALDLSRLA